jgi:hypothetical protein
MSGPGYGAVQAKALEAAKSVAARRMLTDDERRKLRRETEGFQELLREAEPVRDDEAGDDD